MRLPALIYHLSANVTIMPFVDDFFGSPASGSYRHSMFPAGCADRRGGVFRDECARQQSGGGVVVRGDGGSRDCGRFRADSFRFKWKDTWRCRPTRRRRWWWKTALAARDIFAVVNQAPYDPVDSTPIDLHLRQGSTVYCTLSIAAGATTSNVGQRIRTDAAGVGGAGESGHSSGADRNGIASRARDLDGGDPAVTLQKLTPNQDLQCYFFEPSAIAALSSASDSGFTVRAHGGSSLTGR